MAHFRESLDRVATVVFADGPDGADIVPATLAADGSLAGRSVVVGWLPGARSWVGDLDGAVALMGGYAVRDAIRDGRATYVPIRLSAIPRVPGDVAPSDRDRGARPARECRYG